MLLRAKLTFDEVSKVSKVSKVSIERFFAFLYFYIFKRKNINIFIYKYLYIPKKSFLLPPFNKSKQSTLRPITFAPTSENQM